MSARVRNPNTPATAARPASSAVAATANAELGVPAESLAEGDNFTNTRAGTPIVRSVATSIKATLSDLASRNGRATWAPSADALKSIFQTARFLSLDGASEQQGDLKSTVLHSVECMSVKSTFPVSLGVNITGVDAKTYSSSGMPYSTIIFPEFQSSATRMLQEDDPSVAYAFAAKYPTYNADNLETNGIHAVPSKSFVLVACDHPIMAAIKDNASTLQTAEFTEMPEGFCKMSTSLYNAVLPVVKAQVQSQVRVRDFSAANVTIKPAEYSSWQACLEALCVDACAPVKYERRAALAKLQATASAMDAKTLEAETRAIETNYDALEAQQTAAMQQKTFEVHLETKFTFNHLVG